MGLFGIKKANEEPKTNNTFINENVINAADYSNMPNNTIVGYNQPTQEVVNNVSNTMNNNGETFVYTRVNNDQFNNGQQGQNYYNQSMYNTQVNMNQNVTNNNFSSASENIPSSDVVMTVERNVGQNEVNYSNNPINQGFSGVEQSSFDNSALFALPADAKVEGETSVKNVEEDVQPVALEPQIVLDPLDNANNPIPVNPIASENEKKEVVEEVEPEEEILLFDEEEEIKTNLFTVINMMIGVIIKPGSTISVNARRYKKIFDALSITFWVTMLSFVMSLAGRIIAGCFSRTENAISGASKISLNFSGLVDTNNYIPYLLITLVIGLGAILVVSLVYYISSFVCSKGIHIGTYFAISTLSIVPVVLGFTVLHPIINILSSDVAFMVLIFTIIYALIILFTGINQVLKFKNSDGRIIYNAVNMAIIVSIMLFIFSSLARLNILDLTMLL